MKKAFLCHSSVDKDKARRIYTELTKAGIDVWFDEANINYADSIISKIWEGLEESDILIVLLSNSSVKSPWVLEELKSALVEQIKNQKPRVIPVLIEDVSNIPPFLKDRRYIDCRNDLFDEGISNIVAFLGESNKLVDSVTKVKHSIFVLTGLASSGKDSLLNAAYNRKIKYHPDFYFLTKITTRDLFQDEKSIEIGATSRSPYFVKSINKYDIKDENKYFNHFSRYGDEFCFDKIELINALKSTDNSKIIFINSGIDELEKSKEEIINIKKEIEFESLKKYPFYSKWEIDCFFILIDAPVDDCLRRLLGRNLPSKARIGRERVTENDFRTITRLKRAKFFDFIINNSDEYSFDLAVKNLTKIFD